MDDIDEDSPPQSPTNNEEGDSDFKLSGEEDDEEGSTVFKASKKKSRNNNKSNKKALITTRAQKAALKREKADKRKRTIESDSDDDDEEGGGGGGGDEIKDEFISLDTFDDDDDDDDDDDEFSEGSADSVDSFIADKPSKKKRKLSKSSTSHSKSSKSKNKSKKSKDDKLGLESIISVNKSKSKQKSTESYTGKSTRRPKILTSGGSSDEDSERNYYTSEDDDYYDDDDDFDDEGKGNLAIPKMARKRLKTSSRAISGLFNEGDFSNLKLKPDHSLRPIWVCPDGRIFLETFSNIYKQAYDFLIAISEPVSRPPLLHEYKLTPYSLYAAVSIGLQTKEMVATLSRMSKTELPSGIPAFIQECTLSYGKVKLVLQQNRYFIESSYAEVLARLLQDEVLSAARLQGGGEVIQSSSEPGKFIIQGSSAFHAKRKEEEEAAKKAAAVAAKAKAKERQKQKDQAEGVIHFGIDDDSDEEEEEEEKGGEGGGEGGKGEGKPTNTATKAGEPSTKPRTAAAQMLGDTEAMTREISALIADEDEEEDSLANVTKQLKSFELDPEQVEAVKKRCIELDFPTLEEYDFRADHVNPNLAIDLKPTTTIRPYQEKSLSKMFGNGRGRSGIIVLPCGAGKTLVGVTATSTVKKSTLVLCTSAVACSQWSAQFKLWSTLADKSIVRFTRGTKERLPPPSEAVVVISTYAMMGYSGKRAAASKVVMDDIEAREWGLIVLDEVHVVPANMFRRVLTVAKAHCKLGLTATLVREDNKVGDLNFLIGPKLYEANWLDLQKAGHIASVQCAEVWCNMTKEYYAEYLNCQEQPQRKRLLYVMNPNKFHACELLIRHHEAQGDKVLVFADNVYGLRKYAIILGKPMIYGATSNDERHHILHKFKNESTTNTIFISKVGDNSIDLPEASVVIQISSHFASRRQEAQRLGRILRPKQRSEGEYNAFFYTLISRDTEEMFYSTKRQQFLVDQGYAFKIITDINAHSDRPPTVLRTKEEQVQLLTDILSLSSKDVDDEILDNGDDVEAVLDKKKRAAAAAGSKRTKGSMASLSGASDILYTEKTLNSKGKVKRKGVPGRPPSATSSSNTGKKKEHSIFSKLRQGRL